jgi:hypothetical protein
MTRSAASATQWTEWTLVDTSGRSSMRSPRADRGSRGTGVHYLSSVICSGGCRIFRYWNRSFTSLAAPLKVEAASAPFK